MIIQWQKTRYFLLTTVLGMLIFTLGYQLFYPKKESWSLPESFPLQGWEFVESQVIKNTGQGQKRRQYQYSSPAGIVDIQLRYFSYLTNGDNLSLLKNINKLELPDSAVEVKQSAVGYYGMFAHEGRAYLSASINDNAKTTFTQPQYVALRNNKEQLLSRFFPWLIGLKDLRDWSCLWVTISTPIDSEPQQSYALLQEVWQSSFQWWHAHFP